jgi:hypothetical protein
LPKQPNLTYAPSLHLTFFDLDFQALLPREKNQPQTGMEIKMVQHQHVMLRCSLLTLTLDPADVTCESVSSSDPYIKGSRTGVCYFFHQEV